MAKKDKPAKGKRKKNWLVNFLLLLLFMVGLALIFNNQIKDFLIKWNGDKYAVANIDKDQIEKNKKAKASFDYDAVESASTEAVLRAQLANQVLPVLGGIAIPSVKINLPIFKGVSNTALLYGAGTLSEDQVMGEGNYALASHRAIREDYLFAPLHKVEVGDRVYLTDLTNIYTYKVDLKVRVQPTEVQYLDVTPGKKQVTLITCGERGGKTRIIVQGELKKVTPVKKATKKMNAAFEMQHNSW